MGVLRNIKVNHELTYEVQAPTAKSEIFLADRKKEKQHWPTNDRDLHKMLGLPQTFFDWNENTKVNQEHTEYDDSGVLVQLSVEDTAELVAIRDRELVRRQAGIYFWNKGELEYLSGDNYFFLVHYNIPAVGHPNFRKFQRDVHYVLDIAVRTGVKFYDAYGRPQFLQAKNILGAYFIKAKKTGLSHIIASLFLNTSTMIRDRSFGVMNKTQVEANDVNIAYFWRGYEELPPIMQPHFSHKNLSKVIFGAPIVKFTGTWQSVQKTLDRKRNRPFNTWIFSAPTKFEIKFDGPAMYFIHLDEFPKWKASPKRIFGKLTETVKLQQTINGKIFVTSYPPEEDGDSFEEGKEVYYNSKLSTIKDDGLGRTTSGMICHCVGALDSTDGTFDVYGDADHIEALRLNQAERNQCKNSTELQEKIRQYGRNEEEMWRTGGAGSTFDNVHLALAAEEVEKRERAGELLYVEGNLSWENNIPYTRVVFTPVTPAEQKQGERAYWKMYERYATIFLNKVGHDSEGYYHPYSDTKFVAASDPTEYKLKSDFKKKGTDPSDWAITVMSFPDVERNTMMGRTASGIEVCDYLDRRDDPYDSLMDMIMTIWYFGCYILIEANKQWAVTEMRQLGLHRFLLLRQKDGSILPYEEGAENMAVTSTPDVIETYCRLIKSRLRWPQHPDEIDYCLLLKNPKKIKNFMRFNPQKTQKFDDIVTYGLCLMAMASFSVLRERLKEQERNDGYLPAVFSAITSYV